MARIAAGVYVFVVVTVVHCVQKLLNGGVCF